MIPTHIGLAPLYPYCTATALRIGGRAPIGVIMPESALEQHEIDYRARQIRLGTWIAVGVILIGAVRVRLDLGRGHRHQPDG